MTTGEYYQTGTLPSDLVGSYFRNVVKDIDSVDQCRIEYKEFSNTDTMIALLFYKDRVKAFVIDTRTDSNNHNIIKGTVEKEIEEEV